MNAQSKQVAKTNNEEERPARPETRRPNYAIRQEDNAYRLEVQLPGVPKDAARITFDGNLLEVETDAPRIRSESWKAFRREIPEGGFLLRLEMNVEIDTESISARSADGVLIVTLPLAAKAAKRTIAVT